MEEIFTPRIELSSTALQQGNHREHFKHFTLLRLKVTTTEMESPNIEERFLLLQNVISLVRLMIGSPGTQAGLFSNLLDDEVRHHRLSR